MALSDLQVFDLNFLLRSIAKAKVHYLLYPLDMKGKVFRWQLIIFGISIYIGFNEK